MLIERVLAKLRTADRPGRDHSSSTTKKALPDAKRSVAKGKKLEQRRKVRELKRKDVEQEQTEKGYEYISAG